MRWWGGLRLCVCDRAWMHKKDGKETSMCLCERSRSDWREREIETKREGEKELSRRESGLD